MTIVPFDTLALARRLRDDAKMSTEQAEGIAGADVATRADLAPLATRAEVADLKAELKADIADVKAELKADIAEVRADLERVEHRLDLKIAEVRADLRQVEQRMIIRLGGLMVVAVGILLAGIRYLPHS